MHTRCLGFTLVELLVLIAVFFILACIFLPAPRAAREAARRMSCSNAIRQVGLGCLNYESAYKRLPIGWGGPAQIVRTANLPLYIADANSELQLAPIGRLSANVFINSQIEASTLFAEIMGEFKDKKTGRTYPPSMAPWNMDEGRYSPWRTQPAYLLCPSDPGRMNPDASYFPEGGGRTNYGFCYGDTGKFANTAQTDNANRGLFQGRYGRRLSEITDGASNTIMLGEIATSPSHQLSRGKGKVRIQGGVVTNLANVALNPYQCKQTQQADRYLPQYEADVEHWRGMRWADGGMAISGFNTILPPNSASCTGSSFDGDWGYYSITSYHGSGGHVVFADLSTQYISNSIDSGNLNNAPPEGNGGPGSGTQSPFGVWGALGTRNVADKIDFP